MAKHAHTGSRAYCYTVHNLCKCPRRLFTTTVNSRCRCPTRPFPETLYTVTVNVQQKLTVCVHQDHSLLHCTQCPTRQFHTTLYTVSVQQDHSLLHCTQSVSSKTIPYCIVHSQCLTRPSPITQCSTWPFPTTPNTVSNKTITCSAVHSDHQELGLLHCTLSVSNKTIFYDTVHNQFLRRLFHITWS